ncbi:MAG: redoxin domain-containing protein [Acidobacteria bacterium]|nr:redoxin domain-containing protein [Acidobacteriota bacterium]
MELFVLLLRVTLAGIFAVASVGKLIDRKGSENAARDFGVPDGAVGVFAVALPLAEMAVAILLLFTETSWYAGVAGLIMLLSFTVGMIYQIVKGNAPDCHCFGQIHSEPVGKMSVVRNAVFAAIAGVVVYQGVSGQGLSLVTTPWEAAILVLLFLIACGMVGMVSLGLVSKSETDNLRRRIEVLELASGFESPETVREEVGDPNNGIPIGAPFPDFELEAANGKNLKFDHLLMEGKPMLFFFVSSDCGPCRILYPEMELWAEEFAETMSIWLITRGSLQDNLKKFDGKLQSNLLLQKDKELAMLARSPWTPTALFINADGRVGSHPAVGDVAIRELVQQIRRGDLKKEFSYFRSGTTRLRLPNIGKPIPEFSLPDANGNILKSSELKGKETVALFLTETCGHCVTVTEELKAWEKNGADENVRFVIFSDGELDHFRNLDLASTIVDDPKFAISEKIGMQSAPSAILINAEGVISSEAAVGSPNIWALIGIHREV